MQDFSILEKNVSKNEWFNVCLINRIKKKKKKNKYIYREMLTSVFRTLVNNPFKESFYGK